MLATEPTIPNRRHERLHIPETYRMGLMLLGCTPFVHTIGALTLCIKLLTCVCGGRVRGNWFCFTCNWFWVTCDRVQVVALEQECGLGMSPPKVPRMFAAFTSVPICFAFNTFGGVGRRPFFGP
jgi:hypothetical protein